MPYTTLPPGRPDPELLLPPPDTVPPPSPPLREEPPPLRLLPLYCLLDAAAPGLDPAGCGPRLSEELPVGRRPGRAS